MEVELLKEQLFNNLYKYNKEDIAEIKKAYCLAKDLHKWYKIDFRKRSNLPKR